MKTTTKGPLRGVKRALNGFSDYKRKPLLHQTSDVYSLLSFASSAVMVSFVSTSSSVCGRV